MAAHPDLDDLISIFDEGNREEGKGFIENTLL
jgi:hypothetical protein